jgi:hypothetical protein
MLRELIATHKELTYPHKIQLHNASYGVPPSPPGAAPNVCAIQVYGVNEPPKYVRYISEFSETFCPPIEINRISDIITIR